MARHFNITGELTQELIAAGDNIKVSKIALTNVHDTTPCAIDLYIEKCGFGKFYILKGVKLPIGTTLTHDIFNFSSKANEFSLYVKLWKSAAETPAVDVIL